jgi:small-conductance mechanosensitive channel
MYCTFQMTALQLGGRLASQGSSAMLPGRRVPLAPTSASSILSMDPTVFGIRAGLTLAVILAALLAGRWLATQAGRVLDPEERDTETGRGARHVLLVEKRDSLGPLLKGITTASTWAAALAAVTVIWFYGQGIPAPSRRELGILLGDLVSRIGGSLIVLALALALGRVLQQALIGGLEKSRININLSVLIGRMCYVAMLLIGLVIILAIWGTGLVLPVALIGALTVALSLSLQDILKNLVAGIYLLLEHPFVINDSITVATYTGQVEDIQLRVTVLRTADNQKVLIPNGLLFTSAVVNHSGYASRRSALTVTLSDAGTANVSSAEQQILAALASIKEIQRDPQPQVAVSRVTGGKLELRVEFWLPTSGLAGEGYILSEAIDEVRSRIRDAEVAAMDSAAVPA